MSWEQIQRDIRELVITPTIPSEYLDRNTKYYVNLASAS